MDKHFDTAQDENGNALVGALVTVRIRASGVLASLFEDDETTAKANPIATAADGRFDFCAADNTYDLTIFYAGVTVAKSHVVLGTGAGGTYTDEQARDAIGAALVAGAGMTITVNDGANTITLASTGGYTDEQAQDAVGAMLAGSATIDFTYVDATPSLTAVVIDASITTAKAHAALKDASYCGLIAAPTATTYIIDLKVPVALTINELAAKLTSGTATAKVTIDGVDVTGTSTAFSSTEAAGTASAANAAAAGTTVSLVFTAVSSPVGFAFTIKATLQ